MSYNPTALAEVANVVSAGEPVTPLVARTSPFLKPLIVAVAGLGLVVEPQRSVGTLRVGEQQLVEIAKALSLQSKVLIMDEPTSALSEQEIEVLFRIVGDLKQRGVGIIYITHKLDELPRIADDITVLRDGQLVATRPFAGLERHDMIRLMVGREWSGSDVRTPATPGEEILRVTNLSLPHPRRPGDFLVKDVSFTLRRGEIDRKSVV